MIFLNIMRIFTAIRHSINPNLFYGDLWSSNFYPALQQLGHEIVESQVDLLPASKFMQVSENFTLQENEVRAQLTQQILDEVKQVHSQKPIHLFLSYFYNSHFDAAGFDSIHQLGIATVNFYCNSTYQFELVSKIATKVNFSWHPEKNAKFNYLKVGANPVWVQMGADPNIYHPVANIHRKPKACFVGQRYADRDRHLICLVKNNIPIEVYGHGWGYDSKKCNDNSHDSQITKYLGRRLQRSGSFLSYLYVVHDNLRKDGLFAGVYRTVKQLKYREKTREITPLLASVSRGFANNVCEIFANYEIVLNFSNVWSDGRPGSKLIPHVRLRDFEAPMCCSCYLTGYSDEITEFYNVGHEIDTYSSPDELLDKTKFYLGNPEIAEKLRVAGFHRAIQEHTWKHRFEKLFKIILQDINQK